MKVFALLGLGVGKGQVFVTDNDLIELSNLNRQFLFRSNNIKKPKSECAIAAINKINPEFKGTAY